MKPKDCGPQYRSRFFDAEWRFQYEQKGDSPGKGPQENIGKGSIRVQDIQNKQNTRNKKQHYASGSVCANSEAHNVLTSAVDLPDLIQKRATHA